MMYFFSYKTFGEIEKFLCESSDEDDEEGKLNYKFHTK